MAVASTATTSMHIRIDPELRKDASGVLNRLGTTLSGAINMFLSQVVIRQEIPFKISAAPNFRDETIAALQEGEGIAKGHIKAERFDTVDDLFADLDS